MDKQRTQKKLLAIYDRLFARYGKQNWWPAKTPFEVIIGAILTQSAAWVNVEKAIANLEEAGVLSPEPLRETPLSELARLIYSCGYFNVKALKVKAFVNWLGTNYDDDLATLFATDVSQLREQLLSVHGVGEETADSIILYAAHKPIFVIDAYTRRIIDRLGMPSDGKKYAAYQALFMKHLPADTRLFNEYHALFVNLGKNVCRRRPLCDECCLNDICSRLI